MKEDERSTDKASVNTKEEEAAGRERWREIKDKGRRRGLSQTALQRT